MDGTGATISEGITTTIEEVANTKRSTATSKLKIKAGKEHHNSNVTCQAQNPANRQPGSASLRLTVEYAPHVTVTADHEPIFEKDAVVFKCEADANPSQMTYR